MKQMNRLLSRALFASVRVIAALGLVAILPFMASAATVSVPANYTAIQNAINAASPGDIIEIAGGTVTLGSTEMITIPNAQLGITLRGAGAGSTIIERSSGATSFPFLLIGASTSCATSGATVVEGITFRNSGLTSGSTTSSNAAYRGIEIRSCGISAANPAVIRNCEFLEFRDSGISIVDYPFAYWEFSENTFDGSRLAVWINQTDFVTIHGNTFRDYVVAVGFDPNDVVTDLAITENKMLGGSFDPAPANYYGLYVSNAAAAAGETKNWDISDNEITGSTFGIRINAPTSVSLFQSLTDVAVTNNCIYDNNVLGSGGSATTYGIYNSSAVVLNALNNWWGEASGPTHISNPSGAGDVVSDNVSFSPWSISELPACAVLPECGDFALLADQIIELDHYKSVEGDIHSNGGIEFDNGRPGKVWGNVTALGNIEIARDNTINGDVTANGTVKKDKQATVTGTITSGASLAAVEVPSLSYSCTGTVSVIAGKDKTKNVTTGDYNVLRADKNAQLNLSAGEYFVKTLQLDDRSRLRVDVSSGQVTINVCGLINFIKNADIIIIGGDSKDLTINYSGTKKVVLGKDGGYQGSVVAPNALVELGSKAGFLGSICAKSIAIAKDARVRFHGLGAVPKSVGDGDEEEVTSNQQPVTSYELSQNYPNPFNPATTISFQLPAASDVSLAIYNLNGQLVKMLVASEMTAGRHNVVWDATDARGVRVASGVYLYVIKAGEFTAQKKLVLMK